MKAALVTRLLHTRGFSLALAVLCLVAEAMFYFSGRAVPIQGSRVAPLLPASEWLPSGTVDFVVSLLCYSSVPVLMYALCRWFNVLRSTTSLYVAFFAVMQLSTPELAVQFYTGTVLVMAVAVGLLLLFSCYRRPWGTKHVFLIFLILSALTATQYCYAVYFLVFIMGCAQMRILNGRTVVAAILGAVTPWWLLLGFGIISPGDILAPSFATLFQTSDFGDIMLLVSTGFTAFLLILAYVLNVMKAIAYNAQARAISGCFAFLSLVTMAAMCVDFHNIVSYIPLLNFCASLQLAHFFSVHRAEKSCIAIGVVVLIYIVIFICQTVI